MAVSVSITTMTQAGQSITEYKLCVRRGTVLYPSAVVSCAATGASSVASETRAAEAQPEKRMVDEAGGVDGDEKRNGLC